MGMLGNANVIGNGVKPLYGLKFDGQNDYLLVPLVVLIGDFSIKTEGTLIRSLAALFSGSTYYSQLLSKATLSNERITVAGVSYNSFSSYLYNASGSNHLFEIKRVGSDIQLKLDNVLIVTIAASTADFEFKYFATRQTFDGFYTIPILKWFSVNNQVYNDSNNWGGAQIFGATRIKI